jgi:hypothetical protein
MENYCIPPAQKALLKGRLPDPVRARTLYQAIATGDTGKLAALAFGRPQRFIGAELEIAGSELANLVLRWFNAGGFQADIPALRREFPQLQLRTLQDWLREQGWAGRRAVTVRRDKMGRPLPAAAAPGPAK